MRSLSRLWRRLWRPRVLVVAATATVPAIVMPLVLGDTTWWTRSLGSVILFAAALMLLVVLLEYENGKGREE